VCFWTDPAPMDHRAHLWEVCHTVTEVRCDVSFGAVLSLFSGVRYLAGAINRLAALRHCAQRDWPIDCDTLGMTMSTRSFLKRTSASFGPFAELAPGASAGGGLCSDA
jgi:hypothetical protein